MRAPTAGSRQAAPIDDRHLHRDGCFNARDLGGLPAAGGRFTRRGALVRADSLAGLTAAGWEALHAHGVRTVVDLRNDDEVGRGDAAPALGSDDDGPLLAAFLAERGTTAEALVADVLEALDLEGLLRAGGLTDDDLAALRARMLDEPAPAEIAA